jgi:hypothetical protein
MFVYYFQKLKRDIENLKHLKFLNPIRFQYEEFNESDKSKFGDYLIYTFCVRITEGFRAPRSTLVLLL